MAQLQIPSNVAKNLFNFGHYFKRKLIFDTILGISSLVFVLFAQFFLPGILDIFLNGSPAEIEQIFLPFIIPMIIISLGLLILGILSLVYTILMLFSIASAKDRYPNPDLQKTSLMLILGVVLSIFAVPLVGLVFELIGWDSFKKYILSTKEKSSINDQFIQNIRVFIITKAITFGLSRIASFIILIPLFRIFVSILSDPYNPSLYEDIFTELTNLESQFFSFTWIISGISVLLTLIPLIFSFKISKAIINMFEYAKNQIGSPQQSYRPQIPPGIRRKEVKSRDGICPQCGKEFLSEARFCIHCGYNVSQ